MKTRREQEQSLHNAGVDRPQLCAWLSHHTPTREQVDALNARGYVVCPALGERDYVRTHIQAWEACLVACGRKPDLVIAVLPVNMLASLAHYAAPVEVWRTFMDGARWTGLWERIAPPYVELIAELVE